MTARIVHDLPEAKYHADTKALSASGAKLLLKAPAVFRWRQTHPEVSDNFDYGTAAHALVLGAGLEAVYVAPYDNWQTKVAQAERKIAREDGLSPILAKDWLKVCDMAEELATHSQVVELLAGGQPEVSMYAEDTDTGIMRRGRLDYLRDDGVISDYKSTACADPHVFARASVAQYGYHISEANYRFLATRNGIEVRACALICQEKEPPYLVEVVELDQAAVSRGYELMARACRVYKRCVDTGHWPGYTDRAFTTVSLPTWAFYDDEPDNTHLELESA